MRAEQLSEPMREPGTIEAARATCPGIAVILSWDVEGRAHAASADLDAERADGGNLA